MLNNKAFKIYELYGIGPRGRRWRLDGNSCCCAVQNKRNLQIFLSLSLSYHSSRSYLFTAHVFPLIAIHAETPTSSSSTTSLLRSCNYLHSPTRLQTGCGNCTERIEQIGFVVYSRPFSTSITFSIHLLRLLYGPFMALVLWKHLSLTFPTKSCLYQRGVCGENWQNFGKK